MFSKKFPTIEATIAAMKAEINEAISEGVIPADVTSFSDLHDHCDANMRADDLFPNAPQSGPSAAVLDAFHDRYVSIVSPAQSAVDAWLRAGRPAS